MAFGFVTQAIDALLVNQSNQVVCYNAHAFDLKSIDDVAGKTKQLDPALVSCFYKDN